MIVYLVECSSGDRPDLQTWTDSVYLKEKEANLRKAAIEYQANEIKKLAPPLNTDYNHNAKYWDYCSEHEDAMDFNSAMIISMTIGEYNTKFK